MRHGQYFPNVVSAFPTMSVTIDSTILTGTYPDEHRIPGLHWFHLHEKEFVNYGTGIRETFRIGMRRSIHNMLYKLNHEHLDPHVTTVYEELASRGYPSASINSFVYRGPSRHRLQVPRFFKALTHFTDGKWTVEAPPVFSLGAFSKIRPSHFSLQIAAGNHSYTGRELRYIIKNNLLPPFTFCIFQDLDFRIHFKGPMDLNGIRKIDKQLQKTLNVYGSWEKALDEVVWMVIGDNGHSPTRTKYSEAIIDLRKIYKHYRIAKLERRIQQEDQLAFCVNQRMAYMYVLDPSLSFSAVVKVLQEDDRVDVIAWQEGNFVVVTSGGNNQGLLRFRKGYKRTDIYGQHWEVEGDLAILDITVQQDGLITYGSFPDALARLYGALHSHQGRIVVVNAKPGYEFKAQSTPFHLRGAAHGSLHKQESLVPMIIAGTNQHPTHSRLVDVKDWIVRMVDESY